MFLHPLHCTVLARLRKQLSRYFIILYVKIPEFPIIFFSFPLQLLYHSCDYMVDTLQYVFDEYRKSGFILNVQRTRRNTECGTVERETRL